MKKIILAIVLTAIIGTVIIAQESDTVQEGAEGGSAQAAPQIPGIPGEIRLPMGILNVHGMLLTGARARQTSKDGLTNMGQSTNADGNWELSAINPGWGENRFDLYLDYSFLNYGIFVTTRWQSWGPNSFDDNGYPDIRYASVYAKFFQEKIKVSLGKLTNEIYIMPETRLWKTEGPWDTFSFTEDAKDNEHMSFRLEVKPIPQLNVGVQYFFALPDGTGMWDKYWNTDFAESGVWKEVGLAAEWKGDLFNATAGLRFDSKADPLNKFEAYTYARGYYGDSDLLGSNAAPTAGPRYKYGAEVMREMTFPSAPTDYTPVFTADPAYDGAARAFLGFSVKAVKNMDIIGQVGFYNLGAWDKFGYARMNELVRYNDLGVEALSLGITMSQEFYGNDVFPDDMINAPFFTFAPEVSYKLVDVPGFQLKGTLTGAFGVCPDVLDLCQGKACIGFMMGTLMVDLFYEMEYTDYTDKVLDRNSNLIKTETKNTIGLSVMLMF